MSAGSWKRRNSMSPIERSTKVRSVTVTERPLPRWQEPSDEKDLLKRLAANTDGLSALALNKDETAYKIGSDLRWMREQIREPILARPGTKTQANTAFRKWQEEHVKIGPPSTARRMMKFSERCDKAEPPQLLEYEPGKAYHDKVKKETPPGVLAARAAKKEAQRAVTTAKQGLRARARYVATSPSEF